MSLHDTEIKAWSYRIRTARKQHVCQICDGIITIGTKYFNITLVDKVTPTSEKLRCVAEHLDCRMPWYIPAEQSPTKALARVRIPSNSEHTKPKVRYEIATTSQAGTVTWHAPDRIQLGLELQSEHTRLAAIAEINKLQAILSERIMDALGSKQKMQQLGNDMLRLQAGLNRTPDLSRLKKED